jgi:hypothetical protein
MPWLAQLFEASKKRKLIRVDQLRGPGQVHGRGVYATKHPGDKQARCLATSGSLLLTLAEENELRSVFRMNK